MSQLTDINNTKISASQLAKLLYLYSIGSAVLIVPTMVTIVAKQDAWITMLLVIPLQILVPLLYIYLSERFPNLSIAQYSEKLLGWFGGKLITALFVFYFLMLSSFVLNNISEFLNLSVLPITPPLFINVTFMLVVLYGVFLGIETIARLGEIIYFWTIAVIIVVVLALYNQFNIHRFEPLLYEGWLPILRGMKVLMGFPVAEYVFMTLLLPMVKEEDRPKLKKSMVWSVIAIAVTGIILVLLLQGVLGIFETSRSQFAIFDMAKNINIEEIVVRVEVLVALVWIGSSFMKLVVCVYVLCLLTSKLFKLSNYRPIILPYIAVIIPLSMTLYRNIGHAKHFSLNIWGPYSILQGIVIPLLLFAIAVMFHRKHQYDSNGGGEKLAQKLEE